MNMFSDLRASTENLMSDSVGSLSGALGDTLSGMGDAVGSVGDAVGSVGDAVGSVGLDISNPLENILPSTAEEESPDINSMPVDQAADIIWERMRSYMKEKGGQRATDLFKVDV